MDMDKKILGKGEAGEVAKGTFLSHGQEYAVKTILNQTDAEFLNPDRAEIRLYQQLADQNWHETHLVTPLAINHTKDHTATERAQLVLPLFTEGSLKSLMADKEARANTEKNVNGSESSYLNWSEFKVLLSGLFIALENMHSRGFTHTDIHADQIMPKDGQFFLHDFSRASDLSEIYTEVTRVCNLLYKLLAGPQVMAEIYQENPQKWQENKIVSLAEQKVMEKYGAELPSILMNWKRDAYRSVFGKKINDQTDEREIVPYHVDYSALLLNLIKVIEPKYPHT